MSNNNNTSTSSKRAKTVTVAQLATILGAVSGATPFSATTLTDAKAKKTANPYGTIRKLTRINGFTGTIYENAVNRQMAREGNADSVPAFEAQPRAWGVRVAPALVSHKDAFYLPAQLNPTLKPKPLYLVEKAPSPSNPTAPVRLVAVPKDRIAPWLPADRSTEVAAAQGLERPVTYRDYALSSIVSLSLNGTRYRVRQSK